MNALVAGYKYNLLLHKVFRLDYPSSAADKQFMDDALIRMYGGEVTDEMVESVTHVVLFDPTPDQLQRYKVSPLFFVVCCSVKASLLTY